ncbi:hypothetical protein GCM10022233_87660 [Streptomyces shaanxiensis]|uniref:Uncharacterized protein n=1 Tax=Streptomyces shaanxiensis TaxID=653357 RepID=A0ABP7WMA3_9ACTN
MLTPQFSGIASGGLSPVWLNTQVMTTLSVGQVLLSWVRRACAPRPLGIGAPCIPLVHYVNM